MLDEHLITVGELLDRLKHYPRDTKISFSGLDFYRLKQRGENLIRRIQPACLSQLRRSRGG